MAEIGNENNVAQRQVLAKSSDPNLDECEYSSLSLSEKSVVKIQPCNGLVRCQSVCLVQFERQRLKVRAS